MSDPGTPRIRRAAVPVEATLVVRGDVLDADVLLRDALRFHRRFASWGRYGISAFYASSEAEVDALCESKLIQFPDVVVFQGSQLEAAGIDVVPTFRTPHVTLAADDPQKLVTKLLSVDHIVRPNAYHVPEEER